MPLTSSEDFEVSVRRPPSRDGEWPGESRFEPSSMRRSPKQDKKKGTRPPCTAPAARKQTQLVPGSFPAPAVAAANPYLPHQNRLRETLMNISSSKKALEAANDITLINAVKADYRFIYRINDGDGTVNTILQEVCKERGWREFHGIDYRKHHQHISSYERAMRGATGWNLWWSYSIYQFSPFKYLRPWQFTNHNPKGFQFCNKLYLTQYLRKMKVVHGEVYDFYPLSFIIPEDFIRLSMEHSKRATESMSVTSYTNLLDPGETPHPVEAAVSLVDAPVYITKRFKPPLWTRAPPPPLPSQMRFTPVWISKPVSQSQGKGIFLATQLLNLPTEKKSVIQEYISRPLLIGGYKWDMRLYVCVAAIDPLVIYIYNEGLCRFCTEKYKTSDLTQVYSHLTNASLNKFGPSYEQDKEMIGPGCKWTFRKLRQYFRDRMIPDWFLWQRIMALVVLTVLGDSLRLGYSASNRNCFDLFGFDVLVDEDLKPWLLECNYSPGLGGDSETDEIVKRPMIHQLFDLLGFPDCSSYSRNGTPTKKKAKAVQDANSDETIYPLNANRASSGDESSKDRLTRQYFEMLVEKMKATQQESKIVNARMTKNKWGSIKFSSSPEARLMDAKTIYSQNLVVQYLKNQSPGKISNKVRDQLIKLAAKKLKSKLAAAGLSHKMIDGEEDEDTNLLKRKEDHPATSKSNPIVDRQTQCDKNDPLKSEVASVASVKSKESVGENENTSKSSLALRKTQRAKSAPDRFFEGLKQDAAAAVAENGEQLVNGYPNPSSEAFQKLKHYFDAGVDYPLDLKTGRFKQCPALITGKKDWSSPVKQEGGWVRVYPFDIKTTKSPYKSSLTDVRQAVRSIETYLKTAEQIVRFNPNETDEFYKRKIKQVCKRETETWIPPLSDHNMTNGSQTSGCTLVRTPSCQSNPPKQLPSTIIITEANKQCPFPIDININTSEE